jgi:hypothetical protein
LEPAEQEERRARTRRLWIWTAVILIGVVWLLWWRGGAWFEGLQGDATSSDEPVVADIPSPTPPILERQDQAARTWRDLLGREPEWPEDLSEPANCEQVEQDLVALCREIDGWPSIRDRIVGGGSCSVLRQAAEELASRPPAVSGELKSYPTILANVFHLFRSLGRKRVVLLRDMVNETSVRGVDEPAAMVLYRWLISRENCDGESVVGFRPLYEYAGFLTDTLGGRAFMGRRSPRQEALIGFYTLLILDRAVETRFNPNGIDPRLELGRVRALLADQPLLHRIGYQNTLDAMDAAWRSRELPD